MAKKIVVVELNKLRWAMPNTCILNNVFPVKGNERLLKLLDSKNIKYYIK